MESPIQSRGAIEARLGVNLDYPRRQPDDLEYCAPRAGEAPTWKSIPSAGNWFPNAFVGTMVSLMRFANGEAAELPTAVEDAFRTMALVEACYESSVRGATPIPEAASGGGGT